MFRDWIWSQGYWIWSHCGYSRDRRTGAPQSNSTAGTTGGVAGVSVTAVVSAGCGAEIADIGTEKGAAGALDVMGAFAGSGAETAGTGAIGMSGMLRRPGISGRSGTIGRSGTSNTGRTGTMGKASKVRTLRAGIARLSTHRIASHTNWAPLRAMQDPEMGCAAEAGMGSTVSCCEVATVEFIAKTENNTVDTSMADLGIQTLM